MASFVKKRGSRKMVGDVINKKSLRRKLTYEIREVRIQARKDSAGGSTSYGRLYEDY